LIVLAIVARPTIADEVESRADPDDSVEHYRSELASLRAITSVVGVKACFEGAVGDSTDQMMRHAERQRWLRLPIPRMRITRFSLYAGT
jgi:hypothetical protein